MVWLCMGEKVKSDVSTIFLCQLTTFKWFFYSHDFVVVVVALLSAFDVSDKNHEMDV